MQHMHIQCKDQEQTQAAIANILREDWLCCDKKLILKDSKHNMQTHALSVHTTSCNNRLHAYAMQGSGAHPGPQSQSFPPTFCYFHNVNLVFNFRRQSTMCAAWKYLDDSLRSQAFPIELFRPQFARQDAIVQIAGQSETSCCGRKLFSFRSVDFTRKMRCSWDIGIQSSTGDYANLQQLC